MEKNNINVVICHFQFSAAIKKQPAHVVLFNGIGTYQMSLGFTRSDSTLVQGCRPNPSWDPTMTVEPGTSMVLEKPP